MAWFNSQWVVKNLIEFKLGIRALVQGNCAASTPLVLNQAALGGFRVTVLCQSLHPVVPLYEITSIAQYGNFGSAGYASRTIVSRF